MRTADQGLGQIMLDRDVAWAWAGETGRAKLFGRDLRAVEGVDTVGEAIVTIANSERQQEDFGLVYKIIARANSAVVLSDQVLKRMVDAAEGTFGDLSLMPPEPAGA